MIYIDENHQTEDILKYLHDIRKELETFRHTMVGLGMVLIVVQILSTVLK
tara:strand:- start:590 stop:739 length:150 start_codon:yes stop_codon:yes gene_type:complete